MRIAPWMVALGLGLLGACAPPADAPAPASTVALAPPAASTSAAPAPVAGTVQLRVRNAGPDAAVSLRVQFPPGEVAFGDVPANTTTAYRPVPGGVYGYAAYRLRIDGREVSVPVIDWMGEVPLEGVAFTYVVAVDARAPMAVTLVGVERDR